MFAKYREREREMWASQKIMMEHHHLLGMFSARQNVKWIYATAFICKLCLLFACFNLRTASQFGMHQTVLERLLNDDFYFDVYCSHSGSIVWRQPTFGHNVANRTHCTNDSLWICCCCFFSPPGMCLCVRWFWLQ